MSDSSNRGNGCEFAHGRKTDAERGAFAIRIVRAKNLATVFFHDSVADAQAQASSLANSLRREERIEYAFRLANSRTVVAERYFHVIIPADGRYLDTRSLGLIAHCVVSI